MLLGNVASFWFLRLFSLFLQAVTGWATALGRDCCLRKLPSQCFQSLVCYLGWTGRRLQTQVCLCYVGMICGRFYLRVGLASLDAACVSSSASCSFSARFGVKFGVVGETQRLEAMIWCWRPFMEQLWLVLTRYLRNCHLLEKACPKLCYFA